jgi:hypothetical protein
LTHTQVHPYKDAGKGCTGTISVEGRRVAWGRIDRTMPSRFSLNEGPDIDEDTGMSVMTSYDMPSEVRRV